MNAFIFIRQFTIFINNKHINKKIHEIMKPKLVFYKNHNLLIYFKIIMIKMKTSLKVIVEEINSLNSFESFDSDDDLFDIENI